MHFLPGPLEAKRVPPEDVTKEAVTGTSYYLHVRTCLQMQFYALMFVT